MQQISPFLWFDQAAEEAANFYVSVFKGASRVLQVVRSGDAGPGPKGSAMTVQFELRGQKFIALNGGPRFRFTEAISLVVQCDTQGELDTFWEALSAGGEKGKCGWLKDRYGLSWQVVPTELGKVLGDPDPARARRAMEAMLQMSKLDIEALRRAAGR
ncbi:MAG: VOC family protein [Myxococcales bacterium]